MISYAKEVSKWGVLKINLETETETENCEKIEMIPPC